MRAAEKRKPAGDKAAGSLEMSIAGDDWEHTPDASDLTRQKRWRLANPDAYQAHLAVSSALARGILVKPDACEVCGKDGQLDAHHDDHRLALDVRWLCRACHVRYHAARRKAGGNG